MRVLLVLMVAAALGVVNSYETCSIEKLNATLDEWEPKYHCLCDLDNSFYLTNDELDLLFCIDDAFVNACVAFGEGHQCTYVRHKVHTFTNAIDAFIEYVLADGNSSLDLSYAVNKCVNGSLSCDTTELDNLQSNLSCIVTLNSSFVLNDSLVWIVNEIVYQNSTAYNACQALNCSAVNNATATILQSIQDFTNTVGNSKEANDTGLACALNNCLYGNVTCNETCSIEKLNATLDEWELTYHCLCDLDNSFYLTGDELDLLFCIDDAFVKACVAVSEGNNCTDVSIKVQTLKKAIDAFIAFVLADGNSSLDLLNAVNKCGNGSLSCDTTELDNLQSNLSCIVTLNSSFVLNDSLVWIVDEIVFQNSTAYNACQTLNCSTVKNATASILELIQNFTVIVGSSKEANDTGLACALNNCLYGNVTCNKTCSIEDALLTSFEPELDCLLNLDGPFNLTDVEAELLFKVDAAYVKACLAVGNETNCTVVSCDVQLFIDAIDQFVACVTGNEASSDDFVNAVYECECLT